MPGIKVTCSWCHRTVEIRSVSTTGIHCPGCGHNPAVPRASCDCAVCQPATSRGLLADGLLGGVTDYGLLGNGGQGGLLGGLFPDPAAGIPDFSPPPPDPGPGGDF